jgi:GDP-4-dehydro-6-deoxy-D-mannose reductase
MPGDPRTVLITGAGGFVGRHLIAELESETDWAIIGLQTKASTPGTRARMLSCDLRDADLVARVIDRYRPDVIIHLAAQSYVPKAFASPADTIVNNISSQVHVLEACRAVEIDPIVLVIGSSEEYGSAPPEDMPLTEDQPFRPANPYAVSKIAQDMLGLQYWLSYGMKIIRLRPFNHIGPGQSDRFVVSNFARQVAEVELGLAEPVVLTGNLSARRDFLDVRDVARAYRMTVDRGQPGEVYNLASGTPVQVGELLESLTSMATVSIAIRHDPARMRPSDTPLLYGDATRLRRATGWAPRIQIKQSLRDTLDYWRNQLSSRSDET